MAFKLERFDILKQNYDKTGLFVYHDTVGAGTQQAPKDGDALATITADDFFNSVVEELSTVGSIIVITATDGVAVCRVSQLYDASGDVEVKLAQLSAIAALADGSVTNAKLATDVKVGSIATLTTEAASIVAAINAIDARVAALEEA